MRSDLSRRRLVLAGLAAAAMPLPARAVCKDPVFSAIATHSTAMAAVRAHDTVDQAEFDGLVEKAEPFFLRLLQTMPTTLEGATAFVTYVHAEREDLALNAFDAGRSQQDVVFATLAASLQALSIKHAGA